MLYVSDFFTRHKEAVSNQVELLASHKSGKIVAATRFMNQKVLSKNERKDGIYVVPHFVYPLALAVMLIASKSPVHLFEEESFRWKRLILNLSGRPVYVSLYRRPEDNHLQYLKTYTNLRKIFVELPDHKELLIKKGFAANKIEITPTPPKLNHKKSQKKFNPNKVSIVFASWNNSERNALHDRGILYLLDLLEKNPELYLTIPLRDNDTGEFWALAESKQISNRVRLLSISSLAELEDMFDESDFVSFVAQERVVKDVPNSLIDGLAFGKPCIISDLLDFSKTVNNEGVGYVIKSGTEPKRMKFEKKDYEIMSQKAFDYSMNHQKLIYQQAGTNYEELE